MTDHATYLVDTTANPITVRVCCRATYMNCAPFGEFLDHVIDGDAAAVKIDFENCTGMDSTFLGLLAGAAMKFQSRIPPGKIIARKLSPRNNELIHNLGIARYLEIVEPAAAPPPENVCNCPPPGTAPTVETGAVDRAEMLRAHENLITVNPGNSAQFQDVIEYLKKKKS